MPKTSVLQAIRSSAALYASYKGPDWSKLENYVASGDRASLAALKPVKSENRWFFEEIVAAIASPKSPSDEERRALEALARMEQHILLADWLERALASNPPPDEDLHGMLRAMYEPGKVSDLDVARATLLECHAWLERDGQPSSAGRFLLGLSDDDLKRVAADPYQRRALLDLLLNHAPERVPGLLDVLLDYETVDIAQTLLSRDPQCYEAPLAGRFAEEKNLGRQFDLGAALAEFDCKKYEAEATRVAREAIAVALARQASYHIGIGDACLWLIERHGAGALADVSECLRRGDNPYILSKILDHACKALGRDARPAALSALERGGHLRRAALARLIEWNDPADAESIAETLREGFQDVDANEAASYLSLAGRWDAWRIADELWKLVHHKSKPVRSAAARALVRSGEQALPRAQELLRAKKAAQRACAVTVLAGLNSDEAIAALEARLDEEPDDEVRDQMLAVLEAGWDARGKKIDRGEIERRAERAGEKLAAPVASWLKEQELPPLSWIDGGRLDARALRYLLFRQSRAKEMRPDVEAKPLYALIDRTASGDFALAVLKGYLNSSAEAGDRWALALAGLLGDERVVPILAEQVRAWVDNKRGKMAEYAVQALALQGSDAALSAVDAQALRYRSKQKNVGAAAAEAFAEAAQRFGITPDELGDRVVPWLGFAPGRPRLAACGSKQLEVRVTSDFKFEFYDPEKKKRSASLPSGAPAELKAEFKTLSAMLREVVKGQLARMENLMVRQFRWPVARWRELYLEHPLLFPFATRLAWGAYGPDGKLMGAFRALDDRTLTDERDEAVELPDDALVGIVHPLELSDELRQAWRQHLIDYSIAPPFEQIERPVVRPVDGERQTRISRELRGTSLNGMTFKGRAERLGWQRGSVCDGGCIPFYRKSFPGAGVDVLVNLEGMYIGIDIASSVELLDHCFVRGGSVSVGSYVYDQPTDENDSRLIAFGDVPPVVFSETAGDLTKIVGAQDEAD